jgi:prepilin-type N-terminal cleavage/methylation domain-containing protein/prepilin-type processing-associated H-X9-DG protein
MRRQFPSASLEVCSGWILQKAFTLMELLVVIAVIAVVAGLALPAFSQARRSSAAAKCLNQMRQLGAAAHLYAGQNENRLPGSRHEGVLQSWEHVLQKYAGKRILYRCPSDPHPARSRSYAINDFLTSANINGSSDYARLANIPAASQTIYMAECHERHVTADHFHFADEEEGGYSPPSFQMQVETHRHHASSNYLFADGHAESLPWETVNRHLTEPGSRFVNPEGNP